MKSLWNHCEIIVKSLWNRCFLLLFQLCPLLCLYFNEVEILAKGNNSKKNIVFYLSNFSVNIKNSTYNFSYYAINYDSWLGVLTYNINKNDVGIIINKAVAINPRILTSIMNLFNIIFI